MNAAENQIGQVVKSIRNRMKWDIRVSRSDVEVFCEEPGEVIVRGEVDSAFRKQAVMEIVESNHGVIRIVDQVQIRPEFKRSDDELRLILCTAIQDLKFGIGEWIDVSVTGGVVRYSGVVFRPRLKAAAAKAAWELSGVLDCQNEILVKPEPSSQMRRMALWPAIVAQSL